MEELSGAWTLDISWYLGFVATTVIGVVSYGSYWYRCVWLSPTPAKLDVSQHMSC